MKYLIAFGLLLTLTLAGRAYAQSLDDLNGLPSGTGITVTDTPSAPAPEATPAATAPSTPAPAAATTGPGEIVLVVGGIAVLAFILLKARPGRARYRI